jgi:membrane-associated phospholipid phosphatase
MKEKKRNWWNDSQLLKVFFLLYVLFSPSAIYAQSDLFPTYPYTPNKDYFKSYWTVTKKVPTGPARWKTAEWVAFSGILAGGTVIYLFDDQIREWIQRNPTQAKNDVAEYVFEPWGSGIYPVVLLGGFYAYGLAAKKALPRQVAMAGVQAFIMTRIATVVIKQLTHRHRPYQDDPANPRLWEGPIADWHYNSFPSGHTSTAFALATLFSSVYRDKIWVGILSYGIATGVAWSRVYDNQHWASDVFIGAALGFAIGKTVYHVMQGNSNLSLGISSNGGVSLVYHLN